MQTQNITQGSAEWLAYRGSHFNASDAPAMLGVSPYKTRSALLREMHTGIAPEVDAQTERLFSRGHRFEAQARMMAEGILDQDLFPVVGSLGRLSASFDGLTMAEDTAWEHKTLNDEVRSCFLMMETISPEYRERAAGCELPLHHRAQMEQQLHVSGAGRALFTASVWNDDGSLREAVHCWYYPDAELRARILNGWAQFEKDLAEYTLPAIATPAPAGRAPSALPALRIEVSGQVTASNLDAFKATAFAAIRSVNRELATDVDFADAEASVKWCADIESRLAAAKEHALSQTAGIDAVFKTVDDISAEVRRTRLDLEKLVKARKDSIREEIVIAARIALKNHAASLAAECAPAILNQDVADFANAIKGKRTVTTLRDAADAELVRAKIALDHQARDIRFNLGWFRDLAIGREFLFPDLAMLAHKQPSDFEAALRLRIADHEAEKARQEAAPRAAEAANAAADGQRAAKEIDPALAERLGALTSSITAELVIASAKDSSPAAHDPATLKLGAICERLGFTMTAAFVFNSLGIAPAATDKNKTAKLYREGDFGRICEALISHIAALRDQPAA